MIRSETLKYFRYRRGIIFLILLLGMPWGCKKQVIQGEMPAVQKPPYLFIHGIKGGTLIEQTSGRIQWLTAFQGLGWEASQLALPLQWKTPTQQETDQLEPSQPLNQVSLIPGLVQVDIYQNLKTTAPQFTPHFYPFAYDWRRSNLESRDRLLAELKELKRRHQQPVNIVAHSMGGLITLAAMQQDPTLFNKVFFVGVPFAGGVGFLEDLHAGTSTGLNQDILTPEILATMPSVYSLFPLHDQGGLGTPTGEEIPVDFYNPADWQQLKIGPFAHAFSKTAAFQTHFKNALGVAKTFREQMGTGRFYAQGQRQHMQPKLYVVRAKNRATRVQFVQEGERAVRGWDFTQGKVLPGDGRVSAVRAQPPEGLDFIEFIADSEHTFLLNDPKVIDWIFSQ